MAKKKWVAPPANGGTILTQLQQGVANLLHQRTIVGVELRSAGCLLIEALSQRIGQNELGRRVGQSASNMSTMRHGSRPIPESVLIAMCEMSLESEPTHE